MTAQGAAVNGIASKPSPTNAASPSAVDRVSLKFGRTPWFGDRAERIAHQLQDTCCRAGRVFTSSEIEGRAYQVWARQWSSRIVRPVGNVLVLAGVSALVLMFSRFSQASRWPAWVELLNVGTAVLVLIRILGFERFNRSLGSAIYEIDRPAPRKAASVRRSDRWPTSWLAELRMWWMSAGDRPVVNTGLVVTQLGRAGTRLFTKLNGGRFKWRVLPATTEQALYVTRAVIDVDLRALDATRLPALRQMLADFAILEAAGEARLIPKVRDRYVDVLPRRNEKQECGGLGTPEELDRKFLMRSHRGVAAKLILVPLMVFVFGQLIIHCIW